MVEAASTGVRVEDVEARTATSATFANPDGTWTTEVSSAPIHYRGPAQEGWLPIDTRLVATDRSGFAAENAANSFRLLIADDAARGPVRLEDGSGGWLEFRLLEQEGLPEVAGRAADIADGPGLSSVRYESMPTGVKEDITLPGLPSQSPVFTSTMSLSAGLSPSLVDNEVLVTDGQGRVRFRVPAPFMSDQAGASTGAVALGLEETGAGWRVTVTPDPQWLSDPERVFPVVVDPSVTTDAGDVARDTYMSEANPTDSFDTNVRINVGTDDGAGTRRRGLLKIGMPNSVPSYADVTSQTVLQLFLANVTQTEPIDVSPRLMNHSWDNGARWNGSGTGTLWDGATGYFGVDGPSLPVSPSKEDSWIKLPVEDDIQGWVSGSNTNQGWLIKTEPDRAGGVSESLRHIAVESPSQDRGVLIGSSPVCFDGS